MHWQSIAGQPMMDGIEITNFSPRPKKKKKTGGAEPSGREPPLPDPLLHSHAHSSPLLLPTLKLSAWLSEGP